MTSTAAGTDRTTDLPRGAVSAPEAHGIPTAAVLDLLDDLERPGLEPHGLVVARHGVPVLEGTWAPYDAGLPGLVYSVSKTFTSIAIGHLVAEGRLSVTDLAGTILGLPDLTGITVRHLLSMNTGHSAEQVAGFAFDSAELLATVPAHRPGTHFVYNSPASMVLSTIVTTLTGERVTEYLRHRTLEPLGIDDPWWVPHQDHGLAIDQGFSGLHLTAAQVGRLAVAMADGGRYGGVQVIPAAWVEEMAQAWSDNRSPDDAPDADHDWARGYGYQVWRSRRGFRADGAYGQFGLALPEQGLAIGYRGASRATHEVLEAFWRFADRVVDGELPEDADAASRLTARLGSLDTWPAHLGLDPEPTPSDVVSPVPWTLLAAPGDDATDDHATDDHATDDHATDDHATGDHATGDHATGATGADQVWRIDVGGQELSVTADGWTTEVLPWADAAPSREPDGAGSIVDPVLVLALRARTAADGRAEIHAVVPTSPHRLIARGVPGERLDLNWTTSPLWRPALSTLVVPGAHAARRTR